ncbi:hypothetical protein C2S52_009425 [Perilla frutescens var. hirtella]|nr:hypothetical protein C2S52_009425 [Perilla frutescens var. hirtella]
MGFYERRLLIDPKPGRDEDSEVGDHSNSTPTVLVLSMGIIGAAFLIISYLAMRRYASRRRRSSPPLPTIPNQTLVYYNYNNREDLTIDHPIWHIRTVGLPQSAIESIETLTYKKGEGFVQTTDCSVCLSEFQDGDTLKLLPKCTHAFHVSCIDTWLGSHTNCPLCRAPILVAADDDNPSTSGEITSRISDLRDQRLTIDPEMEPVRRSVSLDFSSNAQGEKETPFSIKRSMSLSQSIPV